MSINLFHQEVADTEVIVGYARVAPERAFDRSPEGLTYGIPKRLSDLLVGERVIVPLGRGDTATAGVVVEVDVEPGMKVSKIKAILRRDEKAGGALPSDLVKLGQWIASYYCAPLGMTLASMLPAAVKHGSGIKRKTMIDFADEFQFLIHHDIDTVISERKASTKSGDDEDELDDHTPPSFSPPLSPPLPPPLPPPPSPPFLTPFPLLPRLSKLQKGIIRALADASIRPVESMNWLNLRVLKPFRRLIG